MSKEHVIVVEIVVARLESNNSGVKQHNNSGKNCDGHVTQS